MTNYSTAEVLIVFGFSLAVIVGFLGLAEFVGWLLFRRGEHDDR